MLVRSMRFPWGMFFIRSLSSSVSRLHWQIGNAYIESPGNTFSESLLQFRGRLSELRVWLRYEPVLEMQALRVKCCVQKSKSPLIAHWELGLDTWVTVQPSCSREISIAALYSGAGVFSTTANNSLPAGVSNNPLIR